MSLEVPQNINAKKIISDASVLGFGVLSDSEEASIYQAERDIRSAQGDVRRADGKVNEAENQQRSAEAESDSAQAKQKDGENNSNQAPTEDSVRTRGNDANSIMSISKARSQSLTTASQSLTQASSVFEGMLGNSTGRIEGFSVEITSITSENQALIADNKSLIEQSKQQNTFDGTGSGTSSAYSLSTGAEVQNQQLQNPQQEGSSQGNDIQARLDANNAKLEANGAKADELTSQAESENQSVEAKRTEGEGQVSQQEAANSAAESDNNAENSTLDTIGDIAKVAADVGGTLDSIGDVVKAAGIGVTAAGTALSVTGGAVGVTGATVTGIGAGITAIGAPLCALFGIGIPIVGAGGTTTGSGVATGTVGTGVAGTGSGLVGTGTTVQNIGSGLNKTGKGIKAVANLTTAGVNIAKGDVMGAIKSTAGAVGSVASFTKTLDSAKSIKPLLDNVINGSSALKDGIAAYQEYEKGNYTGMVANGLSSVSYGLGMSDNQYMQSASDFVNAGSAFTGAGQDIANGNYADAAFEITQGIMDLGGGVGNYRDARGGDNGTVAHPFETDNSDLEAGLNRTLGGKNGQINYGNLADRAESGRKTVGKLKTGYDRFFGDTKPQKGQPVPEAKDPYIVQNLDGQQQNVLYAQNYQGNGELIVDADVEIPDYVIINGQKVANPAKGRTHQA